jgi:tRNA (mo5U34)-methyltransferase
MLKKYNGFWQKLEKINIEKNDLKHLIDKTTDKLIDPVQGDYPRWLKAYQSLPALPYIKCDTSSDAVTCTSRVTDMNNDIKQSYQGLIPWRKGPFNMFDTRIDSEWQSFMKWNRIEQNLPDLKDKKILDVGCGNGYYMFKMLQYSPFLVMGIDPGLLQTMQFWSIDKYINSGMAVLPLSIQDMPKSLNCFDVVFSMGVLYHRKSPIHHLKELASCLNANGQLVIETLIIDGDENSCLIPTGRYAQMRNVWFLPSIKMLEIMIARSGFKNINCIDVTVTTIEEQRTTEWMEFYSLKEFLNDDLSQTIEGYPLPKRATIIATKK